MWMMQGSASEVVAASVIHLAGVPVERGLPRSEWDTRARLRNFSVVRKLDGQPFPPGAQSVQARCSHSRAALGQAVHD